MAKRDRIRTSSRLFRPLEGEQYKQRHRRRRNFNLAEGHKYVEEWCLKNNVTLMVKQRGNHWILRFGDRTAEWFPSVAKLVFDRQGPETHMHVHDYIRCVAEVEREFFVTSRMTRVNNGKEKTTGDQVPEHKGHDGVAEANGRREVDHPVHAPLDIENVPADCRGLDSP